MPFVFSKKGIYYRPVKLLTTHQGVSKDVDTLVVCKGGSYHPVWKYADTQRMLILSNEIPQVNYASGGAPSDYLTFEFPQSGIWRVVVIGDGASGGQGGDKWAGYSGGQGGGGGTGGCIVIRADMSSGVSSYLRLSRLSGTNQTISQVSAGSINCEFIGYNDDVDYAGFWVTPGNVGGTGETAAAFVPNPDGGTGGRGGKVYYYLHQSPSSLTEITDCIGYNGGNGAKGYGAGPPMNTATGHAGEAPQNINEYSLANPPGKIQYIPNVYQRPDDYYTAVDYDRPNAIQGYTLDHLALGNAGMGGWKTVVDGDLGPGQGALGGVVIEKLT